MGRMSAEEDYKGCWDNGADAAVVSGAVGSNADPGSLNVSSFQFRLNTVMWLTTWSGFKSLPLHLPTE